MSIVGLMWVLIGGCLEPVWVIGLKKYGEQHSLKWLLFTVIFMYLSPACLAFAMGDGMSVGMAYSIWTGLGAVFAMVAGYILFKEKLERIKIFLVFVIIIGVVGLELSTVMM
ncbi:MAG: QacE family quaternary ammonium compound efflux SMR transporter [Candidatus Methanomethylophilaceae archaeon]|nr:QacE family quaternary ammonium compound efflux SMR transporter [Candidatus Methanomethylophilaceae archaeon]